ncbi:hypothetical protein LIER_21690 [Lithospermum erythrorhizon]|uniref:Uncharacterized protein n=1 Tax=Lithospermum erythrorhizon TaxID=34254 RepID=A0AAV3QVA6_LITER
MIRTRLDIAQAVETVGRYMTNPESEHWTTMKRVLRNVKGTSNVVLCYGVISRVIMSIRILQNSSSGDNSQSLIVQNLKSKLEYLRSRIRENVSIIKPSINMETSTDAMGALQHLEGLAIAGF